MSKVLSGRIANLPISESERHQALGYLATGEAIADALVAIVNLFKGAAATAPAQTLKHSH